MNSHKASNQRGIALIFCLIAIVLLTGVTASLILMSGTETTVNANYRTEEIAYFAAKSGIYEALDRMQQSNGSSIASQIPTAAPSASGGVLYLINAASGQTVKPWDTTNAYYDDEFCHEGYSITGMTSAPPDVPCTTLPTGSTWYTTATSNAPWHGTSAAIPYEWVRINWKGNNSVGYLSGGTTPTATSYAVNGSSSTSICYNGGSEVLLSPPAGASTPYSCTQYLTCGVNSSNFGTPVLLITALAVTPNGSRQMVQAEAALTPPTITVPKTCGQNDAYGFFAYGGTCSTPGLTIGGNATVDGYNSSVGTYAATKSASLGDVGTNGGAVAEGTSTSIGGNVYVPAIGSATPPGPGTCPGDDFSITGSPHYGGLVQSTVQSLPTISIPANTATTTVSSGTIVPGNYGTLSVGSHGTVTLTAPGTYNFKCINVGSWGTVTTSPASAKVTINVSGSGCASAPITFNSHAVISNSSGISSNIQINVPLIGTAGSAAITVTGGPQMYCILNAPYASVSVQGGSDFYGTIMAYTIDDQGGTNLHFDAADTTISGQAPSVATATATGAYNMLAFHALSY